MKLSRAQTISRFGYAAIFEPSAGGPVYRHPDWPRGNVPKSQRTKAVSA
jgi:hypothetical protein